MIPVEEADLDDYIVVERAAKWQSYKKPKKKNLCHPSHYVTTNVKLSHISR